MTDTKKKNFGFKLDESVIDVAQAGYAISYEEDVLHTYGIEPCCGLVLCDENVRILFRLDGSVSTEDVIEITDKINLSSNTMAIVIPGASCGMYGSFDYKKMEEIFRSKGYEVMERRISATFGFVTLDSEKVTIGTGIDRSLDFVIPIPKGKRKNQSHLSRFVEIEKLINLKQKLLDTYDNKGECR